MTATAKKLDRPTEVSTETEVTREVEKAGGDPLLTTREVAEELGTDPRTLRKFLRDDSTIENAGKGNRYEFRRNQLKSLKKGFAAWGKARQAEAKAKAEKATQVHADAKMKLDAPESTTPKLDALAREELEGMTVKQLRELAADREVEVAAKAKKVEVIDAILAD